MGMYLDFLYHAWFSLADFWPYSCLSLLANSPSPLYSSIYARVSIRKGRNRRNQACQVRPDIFFLKHESSIFRSFIKPCMWFLIGSLQLVPQLLGTYKTTDRVGWMIWIYYSRALERRCLATTLIGHPQIPLVELICCHSYSYIHTPNVWNK